MVGRHGLAYIFELAFLVELINCFHCFLYWGARVWTVQEIGLDLRTQYQLQIARSSVVVSDDGHFQLLILSKTFPYQPRYWILTESPH